VQIVVLCRVACCMPLHLSLSLSTSLTLCVSLRLRCGPTADRCLVPAEVTSLTRLLLLLLLLALRIQRPAVHVAAAWQTLLLLLLLPLLLLWLLLVPCNVCMVKAGGQLQWGVVLARWHPRVAQDTTTSHDRPTRCHGPTKHIQLRSSVKTRAKPGAAGVSPCSGLPLLPSGDQGSAGVLQGWLLLWSLAACCTDSLTCCWGAVGVVSTICRRCWCCCGRWWWCEGQHRA